MDGEAVGISLGTFVFEDDYDPINNSVVLKAIFENGKYNKKIIYPRTETIEQAKFNVDANITEELFGNPPIVPTKSFDGWAQAYLENAFSEEGSSYVEYRLIASYNPQISGKDWKIHNQGIWQMTGSHVL